MSSIFKRKNKQIVTELTDRLIDNMTGLERTDENFQIARDFVWNKFENNSFPDPNEHLIERQFNQLMMKFVLNGQDERANRLQYLFKEFRKRDTFKQVGISETRMCLLQLVMLLSVNPTGAQSNEGMQDFGIGGVHDDLPSSKVFMSKSDHDQKKQEVEE